LVDKQLKALLTRKGKTRKSNQGKNRKAFLGICGGENRHMKEMTESNLCAVVSAQNTLL